MTLFIFLFLNKMVKKAISHVDANTPHKDRLILTGLVAVLAFEVVNTMIVIASFSVAQAALSVTA